MAHDEPKARFGCEPRKTQSSQVRHGMSQFVIGKENTEVVPSSSFKSTFFCATPLLMGTFLGLVPWVVERLP